MKKTDVQKILSAMKAGFKAVDKRFEQVDKRFEQVDKRFEQVDKRFEQVDKRFEQVDKRFEQVDKRFEQVDKHFEAVEYRLTTLEGKFSTFEEKFDDLSVVVFGHEHRMTEFLTRDEFNIFKSENAAAHDRTAQALERIEQEIKAFQRSQERLEKRVDTHEVVLVKNGLMAA